MATRTVSVDVEDYFGVVTTHTIPLVGDCCSLCNRVFPGNDGSADIEASVAQVVAHVRDIGDGLITKLEKSSHPEIKKHVELAKAKRDGK